MKFNLIGPSYKSQSVNADTQFSMNWYPEVLERGGGKTKMALYPAPGLELVYTIGSSGTRGLITVNGRSFGVFGTRFVELKPDNSSTDWGPVLSDGLPASLAGGFFQVLIVSAGSAYVFDMNANTLILISATVLNQVLQCGFVEGAFISMLLNSVGKVQIQASAENDATSWDQTAFTIPSVFTDNANSIFIDHGEMWVGGPRAIQVYGFDGNIPFPLDPIDGAFIEHGVGAPFSFAKADNSIFWLEADDRGNGIVRRANGYQPARVSDHALERELQNYPRIDDAVGASFQINGHEIYQLNFPTAEKTKRYDCATGMWCDAGFWNTQAGRYTRHRAQFHTFNFGKHLVGDPTTGAVYRMSDTIYKDFGNVLRRERIGPHLCDEQRRISVPRIQADLECGVGPIPPLQGTAYPTLFTLIDPTGVLWGVGITDGGILTTNPQGTEADTLFINDPVSNTSWQVTIDSVGVLLPTQVAFGNYPPIIQMVAVSGTAFWQLTVDQVGGLATRLEGPVTRGPEIVLQWSRDGGHTYGNEHARSFGEAGEYKKRAIWYRQGSARDLVPKLVISDPVPARIIECYAEVV